jgi:hypothetical protein
MKYIIKTLSSFEHMYVIEAESESEARSDVMEGAFIPDFFQKHLGEHVVTIVESTEADDDIIANIRKEGYL